MTTGSSRGGAILYWTGAVVLTVFGFLDLVGIGGPFFLTGLAMLLAGRWRRRPTVLWPALVGVWAFVVAYVLMAPLGCTSSALPAVPGGSPSSPQLGATVCTNVLGIDYSARAGAYSPPLMPAFLVGLAAGVLVAVLVHRLLSRGRRRSHPPATV